MDLANLADGKVVKEKIEFDLNRERDLFTLALNHSSFKYRHYQQHGSVEIQSL
ncbi:MAG TPA: hypothetical protein VJG90_07740 [Candidatus Nanoarchaeia archaeon]|nr:hypothetical protein [Candidatus Nanoarchaeia archaeon]